MYRVFIYTLTLVMIAQHAAIAAPCKLPVFGFLEYGGIGVESSIRNEIAPHVHPDKNAAHGMIDSRPGANRFSVVEVVPADVWHRRYRGLIVADWNAQGNLGGAADAMHYASDEWLIGFRAKNDRRTWWTSSDAMYIPSLGGFLHTHATCTPE